MSLSNEDARFQSVVDAKASYMKQSRFSQISRNYSPADV